MSVRRSKSKSRSSAAGASARRKARPNNVPVPPSVPEPARSRQKVSRAFLRGFAASLAIALGIEAALHLLHHHYSQIQEIEDRALDWTVALSRGMAPSRKDPVPFTFLDIDERTYRDWNEPALVPRDKLRRMIETVASACPRVLVVDVDLTRSVDPAADAALLRSLRKAAFPPHGCKSLPLLIFPAALRNPAGESGSLFVRPSFLEASLAGIPNIVWASPLFDRASDWQIRRWRLWERIPPKRDGSPEVMPSIQILVAAAVLEPETPLPQIMERIRSAVLEEKPEVRIGRLELSVKPSRLNQRIAYRYPAELREGEAYPRDPATGRELLSVIPAYPLLRREQVSPDLFRGRIVVIGGSFEEGRDVYRTPLGPMPGALILINSMDSLLEHGEIGLPPPTLRYGLLAASVLVMSLIFSSFPPRKAALIAAAVLILGLLPLSVFLFRGGYWLDFAVPAIAVFLHRLAADVEGIFHRKHAETH
ncbi:MAG TPA: CHASE2 domain-containing protein [Thermoanaerobaculia bacterium]|jgi:hypothetical protein|nr:CHASE2 domain-containing protein [Thermoanaerobaculia bacterium]